MNRRLVLLLSCNIVAIALFAFVIVKGGLPSLPSVPIFWALLIAADFVILREAIYSTTKGNKMSFWSRWFPWVFAVLCLAVAIASFTETMHGHLDAAIRLGGALIWLLFLCWLLWRRRRAGKSGGESGTA